MANLVAWQFELKETFRYELLGRMLLNSKITKLLNYQSTESAIIVGNRQARYFAGAHEG